MNKSVHYRDVRMNTKARYEYRDPVSHEIVHKTVEVALWTVKDILDAIKAQEGWDYPLDHFYVSFDDGKIVCFTVQHPSGILVVHAVNEGFLTPDA